uniref:Glycosyl transferase group 1 n=1 Tax=Caulobacter sp. (strain K31) TaxID=366602 RepID=B0T7Q9_CAUSK
MIDQARLGEPFGEGGRGEASPTPPEVVVDVSGLLFGSHHDTPTGIDRVEMAYAETLLRRLPHRVSFAARYPGGGYGRLSNGAVDTFLSAVRDVWTDGDGGGSVRRCWRVAKAMLGARAVFAGAAAPGPRVYLQLSPRGLERTDHYRSVLRREQARLVLFVHDLIPLERPEFVRDGGAARFARKLETVVGLADGLLVNSRATAAALEPYLVQARRDIPMRVAPLGVSAAVPAPAAARPGKPYFVALGTIEPRKNHLLLLHIWRRWVEREGAAATPSLVLIGRRGWENENVLDLLDRCPALKDAVIEHGRLGDAEARVLMRGATAVLCPSFAEGYGLPVAEALQLGVPVLASDIAAHREVGGHAPDYLDPLDGPAWAAAVRDYAQPGSARRRRQLVRLAGWKAATWADHFETALDLIQDVAR